MSPQELSSAVEDRTSRTSVIRRVAKDRTLGTESNERSPRRNEQEETKDGDTSQRCQAEWGQRSKELFMLEQGKKARG